VRTPALVRRSRRRSGNNGDPGAILIRLSHFDSSFRVLFHNGMTRSFRPLPWIRKVAVGPSCRSSTLSLVISETRAPELYIVASITESRWPLHVFRSGALTTAFISSRDKYATGTRSNRLTGIARVWLMVARAVGSWRAAYRRNERMAARRAFRLRTQLCLCFSSESRKAKTWGESRSARVKLAGAFPRRCSLKRKNRRNVSR